jgi:hypothetical protein
MVSGWRDRLRRRRVCLSRRPHRAAAAARERHGTRAVQSPPAKPSAARPWQACACAAGLTCARRRAACLICEAAAPHPADRAQAQALGRSVRAGRVFGAPPTPPPPVRLAACGRRRACFRLHSARLGRKWLRPPPRAARLPPRGRGIAPGDARPSRVSEPRRGTPAAHEARRAGAAAPRPAWQLLAITPLAVDHREHLTPAPPRRPLSQGSVHARSAALMRTRRPRGCVRRVGRLSAETHPAALEHRGLWNGHTPR